MRCKMRSQEQRACEQPRAWSEVTTENKDQNSTALLIISYSLCIRMRLYCGKL